MFTNTPFESAEKFMFASAEKFTPFAAQESFKYLMDNFKVWGDLANDQAQATQAAAAESFEAFKSVKEPKSAFDALNASAKKGIALAVKHVQEATALSVEQFNAGVDMVHERHPAPEAFAPVGKVLKAAASSIESAVASTFKASDTAPVAAAKKARTAQAEVFRASDRTASLGLSRSEDLSVTT